MALDWNSLTPEQQQMANAYLTNPIGGDAYWALVNAGLNPGELESAYNAANPGTPSGKVVPTPDGGYYMSYTRPNGTVYSIPVNPDGTPKEVTGNTLTAAEQASGIGMVGAPMVGMPSGGSSGTGTSDPNQHAPWRRSRQSAPNPPTLPEAGPGGQQVPFGGGGSTSSGGSADPFSGFRVEQVDPNRGFITPGGISDLLNPYQQQVRDQTLQDIERQRQLAQMTTDDQALAAKAFGGNRHGVANALTNDAFAREAGRQYANLNQQGWNTAATLNQANAGNYLAGRSQDISQNQGFMQGALTQRQQDTGYSMGQTSNLINAFQVGNNLLNSSGNMDWNSLTNASNAVNGTQNQATQTQDGGSMWNNLFGNLITGIGLVYRG